MCRLLHRGECGANTLPTIFLSWPPRSSAARAGLEQVTPKSGFRDPTAKTGSFTFLIGLASNFLFENRK